MYQQNKGADSSQVPDPRKAHQDNSSYMMDEHLPEVLSLDVKELGETQGPVKSHGNHVVPPDIVAHRMKGIAVVAIIYVPEPGFVPQNCQPKDERVRIVEASPAATPNSFELSWYMT